MRKFLISAFVVSIALILFSCGNNNKKKIETKDNDKPQLDLSKVPQFNEDTAFFYVKKQTDFGPRVTNSQASIKCADFMASELKKFADEVIVQKAKLRAYNGTILNSRNIIAVFNPKASYRILLCSHWDSRPYADWDEDKANHRKAIDGANDGASGVGVLFEIARQLKLKSPQLGVDIVLFDAEDYGPPQDDRGDYNEESWGLGSQYWAKNPHKQGYKANYGILLDMVGVPNPQFKKEGFSMQYASDIVNKVWGIAAQLGYSGVFIDRESNPITDDHYFVNKYSGIPTINIIHNDDNTNTGFYKHWHTMKDNIENVDKNSLKIVGQTLLTIIYTENVNPV
jgi:Zn-dependent M28 family amino/carboxypeptidase